jgi:hypothetical protein
MDIYKELRNHKKEIVDRLVNYVKTNHPRRTVDHYKCTKDLEYIYSAITDDLVNKTDETTRRIASKFWHKGKRQLSTYSVEFQVYDLLEDEFKTLLDVEYHLQVENLFSKLKRIIEDGPDLYYTEQVMQDRRNVVKFNTTFNVPQYLESIIDNCIENTPVQDNTNFVFLKATKADQTIKDFLVKNFFYNDTFNRHMIAISTAPLVYVVQYAETVIPKNDNITDNDRMQIGIHSGALMQETLNFGYDFAFIGCGPNKAPIPNAVVSQWKSIVNNRWGINCNQNYPFPLMCCCIGRGDFENIYDNTYYTLSTGDTVESQTFVLEERKYRPRKLFT